jgi:hypothetical protein
MNYTVFNVQAYQTSQYVVPRGGIFLGKWHSSFAGSSDGKMNVHSACALNTQYKPSTVKPPFNVPQFKDFLHLGFSQFRIQIH